MQLRTLVAAGLVLFCSAALSEIRTNGFATIAAGQTFDDDVSYHSMDNDLSFKDLSLFGIQFSSDLADGLSATAQLVARGNNDFDAEFEWAYVKYQVNDSFDIKAGRLRLPTYFYSEFIDVSYAYHWLTPPQELYAANITSYDGISGFYTNSVGEVDYSVQVGLGSRSTEFEATGPFEAKYNVVTNLDFSYQFWSSKLIYMSLETTIENELFTTLQLNFPDYPGAIEVTDKEGKIYGAASYFDFEQFFIGVEYAKLEFGGLNLLLAEDERSMITAGYRFDEFTVHYTFSRSEKENDASSISQADPRYGVVVGISQPLLLSNDTHTLGLKYDFHPSAAFKVDIGTTDESSQNTETGFARAGVALVF